MGATLKQKAINIRERLNALECHKHDELYLPSGIFIGKNIFINGDLRSQFVVNQRTFNGTWVDGVYGYDRWKGKTGGFIEQPIEEGNYEPEEFYTLTYDDTSIIVESPASGTWNLTENIPDTSEQIQLEIGDKFTGFERVLSTINKSNCKWFFERITDDTIASQLGVGQAVATTFSRAVLNYSEKRTNPVVSFSSVTGFKTYGSTAVQIASTAVTSTDVSTKTCRLNITVASGLVAGDASLTLMNAGEYIDLDSEI